MFKYYSVIVYLCECKTQIQMIMHANGKSSVRLH
jgi:hypothetical protein